MKVTNMYDLLSALNARKLKIKYKGWSFSGGHIVGDFDEFDILENDEKFALLRVSTDHNEFEYKRYNNNSDYSQDFNFKCSDYDYDDICDDIYDKYLPRDDAEFCSKISDTDGNLHFPHEYNNVSREDVMLNKWTYDENSYDSLSVVQNVMQQAEEIENSQKPFEADFVFWEG